MAIQGGRNVLARRVVRWWWPLAPSLAFAVWQVSVGRTYRATSLLALVLGWMIATSFAIWPRVRWLVPAVVPLLVATAFGVVTTGWDLELATRLARATSLAGTAVLVLLACGIQPQRVLDRAIHGVAVGLRAVIAGVIFVVFIVPAWLWSRVRRHDPVRPAGDAAATWRPITSRASADEPLTAAAPPRRRTFAGRIAWGVGCIVLVLAANYGLGWAWDEAFPTTPAADAATSPAGTGSTTTAPAAGQPPATTVTTLPPLPRDPRADLPAMAAYPWRDAYFDEIRRTPSAYWPFTEGRPLDFDGTYVHQDGWVRRSYEPAGDPDDMPTIWIFGGSTTWGEGQRDEYTISSYIARIAEEAGTPVRVRNYGQRGWVHFQEMVLFEQELALRETPDFAIFYDGANEINAQSLVDDPVPTSTYAYNLVRQLGVMTIATRTADETSVASPEVDQDLWPMVQDWYREHSAIDKVVDFFQGRADAAPNQDEPAPSADAPTTTTTIPDVGFTPQIVDENGNIAEYPTTVQDGVDAGRVYQRWKPVTLSIARRSGVKPFLFWQPVGYDGPPQQAAREEIGSTTIDIHDALEDHPEVFIDGGHTNEEGARIVAERLWETLGPAVQEWHEQHD